MMHHQMPGPKTYNELKLGFIIGFGSSSRCGVDNSLRRFALSAYLSAGGRAQGHGLSRK